MKKFDIPGHFRSGVIGALKERRKQADPRKKDYTPTRLDFGALQVILPRHFGFCYGVENAIEISYQAIKENPGKRIYLLSEMIHNQVVNEDLQSNGIHFIMDTEGNQLIPWDELTAEDIVITPAFGTTLEIEAILSAKGLETKRYNTTCPFVEKVWKRSAEIGRDGHTIIIHGKYKHEETKATFSHSNQNAPSLIIRDMREAELLADFITGKAAKSEFYTQFAGKYSEGFDPEVHLNRIGVVNQTTMLATETQAIADYLKSVMQALFGEQYKEHFADTRDTLCYATNDNQQATLAVMDEQADLALVVGGYNSSNTSQIVTILSGAAPTYFISGSDCLESIHALRHFDYPSQQHKLTQNWLPQHQPVKVILTSGASCPDSVLEDVLIKLLSYFSIDQSIEAVLDRSFA